MICCFSAKTSLTSSAAQPLVLDDDFGEHVFRLAQRQAQRRLQQPLAALGVEIDLHLFPVADLGDDFVEHFAEVLLGRLRKIDDGDFLVQFRRDFHHRRNQHDGFEAVFQVQRDVLELADDGEIVFGQERMEILEDENGRLDLLDDLVQRRERVLGGGVAAFLRLDGGAGGHDAVAVGPLEDFLLPLLGDLDHHVLHAHFLAGDDVKNRITRADEGFEFSLEVHGRV